MIAGSQPMVGLCSVNLAVSDQMGCFLTCTYTRMNRLPIRSPRDMGMYNISNYREVDISMYSDPV